MAVRDKKLTDPKLYAKNFFRLLCTSAHYSVHLFTANDRYWHSPGVGLTATTKRSPHDMMDSSVQPIVLTGSHTHIVEGHI